MTEFGCLVMLCCSRCTHLSHAVEIKANIIIFVISEPIVPRYIPSKVRSLSRFLYPRKTARYVKLPSSISLNENSLIYIFI
jgi:hypothetical protein